ncbi:MAG TPA: hypothetical protein ENF55_06450 [Thermoprotei archaeon]|nr:hypothetical protein [Thermoprotei archaeon]
MKTSKLLEFILAAAITLIAVGTILKYLAVQNIFSKLGILLLLTAPVILLVKIALDMLLNKKYLYCLLAALSLLIILLNFLT